MQIGPLSRSSRRSHGVAGFQLLRVVTVLGLAAAGAFAVSLSVEDQSPSLEAVAAADRQPDGTSAPHSADDPQRTASLQVATADPSAPGLTSASAMPSVAPDEPAQEDAHASTPAADTSRNQATTEPVGPSGDTRRPETEQAGANEASRPAAPEMTGAVNVASIANNPAQGTGLVDLNTASVAQLNSLRNVGPLGRAIIKGRPYASVEDLVKRKVLRRSVYEKIKDQITVR
ncbi:helix-hairpin-helix domain-containing protein [Microvirga vignae]|uniref:helix-hairpin-helix domain-containing protein n=1 Tax=Microvirga vignae TaxID=1225564 RepID=UPI00069B4981|nr:helix-hairpin-helix domain-containing protein [Microvirga vignae]